MASTRLFVIVDDSRSDSFVFGPTPWTTTSFPEWFNGTSQVPDFALNGSGKFGTVQFKFQGTSVAFFGVTPPLFTDSQTFMVSIDGSTPYQTTYADPNPPTYRQWYQSPLLAEGIHNVFLSHISGASIDFAAVTVGNNTPLSDQRVIADNDDPGFTYVGKWKRSQAQFNSGPQPDGNPYHNSTHQTDDIGDTFTYRFSGTSVAIYGIFTWSNLGLIALSFNLDGQSLAQTFRVNSDTPQFLSELGQQQNFLFQSFDFLSAGNHTLVVNLTDCVNQTFAFDYVTYTPAFSTLATMPNLTQTLPSSNGDNAGSQSSGKKSHLGPIVGAIAGLMLLILLGGLIFIFRRRKRGKGRYKPIYPFHRQKPEVTVIPLSDHPTSPTIASFYVGSDSMGMMQRSSATNSGLSYVNPPESTSNPTAQSAGIFTPNRSVRPLPLNPGLQLPSTGGRTAFAPSPPPTASSQGVPRSGAADTTSVFRGRRDIVSEWGASEAGSSPPSYDETTRPPPHISSVP